MKISWLGKVFIGLMFVGFGEVLAIECGSKSEQLERDGEEKYYSLNKGIKLSTDDKRSLEDVYENIKNDWKGVLTLEYCKSDRERIVKSASVRPEIGTDVSLIFKISAEAEFPDGEVRMHTRTAVGSDAMQSLNIARNSKTLKFSEKYRGGGITRSSLFEDFYEIKIRKKNAMEIKVITYINGYFSTEETWKLKR